MKCVLSILMSAVICGCCGCASVFHDPLLAAYKRGEISQQEYERLSQEKEQELARTSPAYWEREHTASEIRYDLNAP